MKWVYNLENGNEHKCTFYVKTFNCVLFSQHKTITMVNHNLQISQLLLFLKITWYLIEQIYKVAFYCFFLLHCLTYFLSNSHEKVYLVNHWMILSYTCLIQFKKNWFAEFFKLELVILLKQYYSLTLTFSPVTSTPPHTQARTCTPPRTIMLGWESFVNYY